MAPTSLVGTAGCAMELLPARDRDSNSFVKFGKLGQYPSRAAK